MEWLVGAYLVVGVYKTLDRLTNPNPALKPVWMSVERNPLKLAINFTLHALFWPFAKG